MWDQLILIAQFMWENLLNIWPYLLITIPIAVAVNLSGASRHISRAFTAWPLVAILLATAVGAFSPFCSCSVIPVIASLLISGVPLAPVMAFWIASPSMDPEIFFLSVAELGWNLAIWRLAGTFGLSLAAGVITHVVVQRGWLGESLLRDHYSAEVRSTRQLLGSAWRRVGRLWPTWFQPAPVMALSVNVPVSTDGRCETDCGQDEGESNGAVCSIENGAACAGQPTSFRQRLWDETWVATKMVLKFMALAFFLEALIVLYVPSAWIVGLLGGNNVWSVPLAAALGVPIYTSNLTALPLMGGLLAQGMNPAAALAFLIAGPTTTLPAMAAVWGLVQRRVFALYVLFSLVGAIVLGIVFNAVAL